MKKQDLETNDYNFVFSKVPRVCVDLLIIPDPGNRVLIGKRNHEPFKNKWSLPGGRVRFNESLFGAASRICEEETGLTLKAISQIAILEFLEEVQLVNRHSISIVYLASVTGNLNPSFCFSEFSTNRHVDESLILPQHAQLINQYLSKIDSFYENP